MAERAVRKRIARFGVWRRSNADQLRALAAMRWIEAPGLVPPMPPFDYRRRIKSMPNAAFDRSRPGRVALDVRQRRFPLVPRIADDERNATVLALRANDCGRNHQAASRCEYSPSSDALRLQCRHSPHANRSRAYLRSARILLTYRRVRSWPSANDIRARNHVHS